VAEQDASTFHKAFRYFVVDGNRGGGIEQTMEST
jgi:hypothetical protein